MRPRDAQNRILGRMFFHSGGSVFIPYTVPGNITLGSFSVSVLLIQGGRRLISLKGEKFDMDCGALERGKDSNQIP